MEAGKSSSGAEHDLAAIGILYGDDDVVDRERFDGQLLQSSEKAFPVIDVEIEVGHVRAGQRRMGVACKGRCFVDR